jgi:hypothetical protein
LDGLIAALFYPTAHLTAEQRSGRSRFWKHLKTMLYLRSFLRRVASPAHHHHRRKAAEESSVGPSIGAKAKNISLLLEMSAALDSSGLSAPSPENILYSFEVTPPEP